MDIHRFYGFFAHWLRPGRMEMFAHTLRPRKGMTVLDIGGTQAFWTGTDLDVTLLNIDQRTSQLAPNLRYVRGDATDIPFPDRSFDVAFSNSTIEHLYTRDNQRKAAREAMRVGKRLWIQTPNRWFPVEPHYLTPFIHWLPTSLRRLLVRNFTIWGLVARPSREYARQIVDEIRLLSAKDLRDLFPGCQIHRERFLGLTKSLIVVR